MECVDDAFGRVDHPALELVVREGTGPAVKDLNCVHASDYLVRQIGDRGFDELVDECLEGLRFGKCKLARLRLVGTALAGDHVGGDGIGCAAEADQGLILREAAADQADGFIDALEAIMTAGAETGQLGNRADGIETGALAFHEAHLLPQRMRNHEYVREQDGRVEIETVDRLQGDFRRLVRRVAKVEKPADLGAYTLVFGQVTSRLAHEPDRR